MSPLSPEKSTNVRVNKSVQEDAGRTLALAALAWVAVLGAASASGLFLRLPGELDAALLAFACAYSVALYGIDEEVRRAIDALPRTALGALALGADAALAAAWAGVDGAPAWAALEWRGLGGVASWAAAFPQSLAAGIAAPVVTLAHAGALRPRRARTLSSAEATSPGGRRAAT